MERCMLLLVALGSFCTVAGSRTEVRHGANPIRKVVTLMQNMQKEVESEGEKEKELHEKFMCFCETTSAATTKKAEDASAKIEELSSKAKEEDALKAQLTQEIAEHKQDRDSAKTDLEEATTLREKEAGEFSSLKADAETNIGAMAAAIPALEKGMSGASFLQLPLGARIRQLAESFPEMDPIDRRDLTAFLQQGQSADDYSPSSGQIVGILKGMKDSMEANLASAVADEQKAAEGYAELKASKEKEIEVATESIESKTSRAGQLAVSAVQNKDGLEDSQDELKEAEKYGAELKEQCTVKEKDYAANAKVRADEVAAISEAIGILNDDDALDVFKKALPSSLVQEGQSFLQRSQGHASRPRKAQAILATLASRNPSPQMDLMLFSLSSKLKLVSKGKVQKFDEIIKMVDDMVALLAKDQADDDKHKAFCEEEFDKASDEEAAKTTKVASIESSTDEAEDAIAAVAEEIKGLADSIAALDKSVTVATEQRKEEHAEYLAAMQMSEAAVQLLEKAKARLNKFYNPDEAALNQEEEQEEAAPQAWSFAQIRSQIRLRARSAADSDEESTGSSTGASKMRSVIALMDQIIHDSQASSKDAENMEKTSQSEYNTLMQTSQDSRAESTKALTDKEASKAGMEESIVALKEAGASAAEELMITKKYISELHANCDFLINNYGLRKEARANESDSLKNAKAMLSGAKML